jgi:predicted amidophosphoribosyltransferase
VPDALLLRLAGLAAPSRCGLCAGPCDAISPLCGRCQGELDRAPPLLEAGAGPLDLAVAVSGFEGVARRVAHGLKFGRRLSLAEVAARAMLRVCPREELRGEVVPVPAAPWRWRWRGFDPAEEIALALARATGLPYRHCLRRRQDGRQVGRPRARRLAQRPRVRTQGGVPARALLVDDVRTTGATLTACAEALRAAGCGRVVALTLARVR